MVKVTRWLSQVDEGQRAKDETYAHRVFQKRACALPAVLLVALALKGILLYAGVVSFDSDEAVVGLMARHILRGARPAFFYGQAYMGSLDAWLAAGAFALLGPFPSVIRVVQAALFGIHVALTYVLTRRWSGDETTALLSALLMGLPPVLLTLYTTVSLGGYGETLLLGDLILLVGWKLATDRRAGLGWWALWGALAGLGFWTLGLIVVYLLPSGVLLLWRHRARAWRGYLAAIVAFLIGSGPWWMYNLGYAWEGVRVLHNSAAQADPMAPILPLRLRLLGLFLIGLPGLFGVRLPWAAEWLSPLVVPVVVAFYAAVAWYAFHEARQKAWRGAYRLLWGVGLAFGALFVFSRFGSDPTGRYLLPLYTPLSVFVAAALAALGRRTRWGAAILAGALLALNLWGTWKGASSVAGLTAQYNPRYQYANDYDEELISFLKENGVTKGYTNYWIAFKIAFLSDERVILAPSLPSKASLDLSRADNRYPPYVDLVVEARQVVYVTGNQPELDTLLRAGFIEWNVTYRERVIGPYRVFYNLSSRVAPSELDPRWQ